MARRKYGDAIEQVKLTLLEIAKENEFIERKHLLSLVDINSHQVDLILVKLIDHKFIVKFRPGLYKLYVGENIPAQNHTDPLVALSKKFTELPELLQSMMEQVIDLMIEPEMEIMNLIERRNKRIEDFQVLLDKSKIELSNSRAKIEELMSKINRLQTQKNRVIPEDRIVFRS